MNVDNEVEVATPRDLFTTDNLKKFECAWESKQPTAFFRGTATGGGVDPSTNQRLRLAHLSYQWSLDPDLNGSSGYNGGFPLLDAKITGWNSRDKKIAQQKMTFIRSKQFPFSGDRKENFVEIYKQSSFKYLLYVEGHCAACRYGFMMQLGSVIFKVESECVADKMWYFPLLRPYYDHIPVKADLSDLLEKLQWCQTHDEECRQIALNAKLVYNQYVNRTAILDYLQMVCREINKRYITLPAWSARCPIPRPVPNISIFNLHSLHVKELNKRKVLTMLLPSHTCVEVI